MSMIKQIFRPGKGSVIQKFTTAVADSTMYPHDWVMLSTTVPTSQGVSGVYGGETLGAFDYIEMEPLLITGKLGNGGLCLGVLMGKSISSVGDISTLTLANDALVDGDVGVVQCHGVHPKTRQVTGGLLGDYLSPSTVAGEVLNGATTTVSLGGDSDVCGVNLAAAGTYSRAGVSEDSSPAFISRIQ